MRVRGHRNTHGICAAGGRARASVVAGSEPLAYCTFGAACSEVEVDALTGESRVVRCDILFDCGRSLNPAADMGQVSDVYITGDFRVTVWFALTYPDCPFLHDFSGYHSF